MLHGLILAAGKGRRFDAAQNKLLAPLGGSVVAALAARHMRAVIPKVFAACPPDSEALAQCLRQAGCQVLFCDACKEGMGSTLAQAIHLSGLPPAASAWCIQPADMPCIAPRTIALLQQHWAEKNDPNVIIAPHYQGQRGHPVIFGSGWGAALAQLQGETGARQLLRDHPVTPVHVDDEGCVKDIDTPADLASLLNHYKKGIFPAAP